MYKQEGIYGLLKLTDDIIVKDQAIVIGQLKSHIEELEYNISNITKDKDSNDYTNIKREVTRLLNSVKTKKNKIETLKNEISSITKNNKEEFLTLSRKTNALEKELFRLTNKK